MSRSLVWCGLDWLKRVVGFRGIWLIYILFCNALAKEARIFDE